MPRALSPADFLALRAERPVLDVRSPAEYTQGHIPGAINWPLFTDEERARVGTLYKQQGQWAAFLLGLRLVGPKLEGLVRQARKWAPHRRVALHCWRGGQRSQSLAWLLEQAGFEVALLTNGYKNYRQHVLSTFEQGRWPIFILGGKTGAGKTKILHALRRLGEQVIDLEGLAHHKGSAFGSIGEAPQPTSEQFENELCDALCQLDPRRRVWIENESRTIGRVYIPQGLWEQMKRAPLLHIEVPHEYRLQNLIADYATAPMAELEAAFRRIEKKLGGLRLKTALEALHAGDFATAAEMALAYYDKTYEHERQSRELPLVYSLEVSCAEPEETARLCQQWADDYQLSPVAYALNLPISSR